MVVGRELKRLAALTLVFFVGCGWTPQTGAPTTPQAAAPTLGPNDYLALTQQLAVDIAFFEAQGDSGFALDVARRFDADTGCSSSWTLGYWQEAQRAEEIVARTQVMAELSKEYEYVAGALHDAMLSLPYTASDGTEQEADFVGVLAAVACGG